jgi:hypothetical protein
MLSSIQRFNASAEHAEKHSHAAIQYAKFYRVVNMELSLDPSDREYGIHFCKQCKSEFDRLLTTSPEIPTHIIDEFNSNFTNIVNKPDIANGLTHLQHNEIILKQSYPLTINALDENV